MPLNINALLNDASRRLKITSDYALSKELGIPEQRLSEYRRGLRRPDTYALVRLALTVGRDPLEVIAEQEAESARSEVKRQFWRDFLASAERAARLTVLVLAICGAGFATVPGGPGFCRRGLRIMYITVNVI
jgi:transcriptional regulator with XRE-family HTH domain